jgi:hypothetical protein
MPCTPSHALCYDIAHHVESVGEEGGEGGEVWPSKVWCPMH